MGKYIGPPMSVCHPQNECHRSPFASGTASEGGPVTKSHTWLLQMTDHPSDLLVSARSFRNTNQPSVRSLFPTVAHNWKDVKFQVVTLRSCLSRLTLASTTLINGGKCFQLKGAIGFPCLLHCKPIMCFIYKRSPSQTLVDGY